MANFYTDVILKSPQFHSIEIYKGLDLLEPITRTAVETLIGLAKTELAIDLVVTETFRSQARQEYLFKQKKTQLQHVGVHNFGLAVDFAKVIDGKDSWEGDWSFMSKLAPRVGLISGYNWGHPYPVPPGGFQDPDHVQRVDTSKFQSLLLAGKWYPDAHYNPVNPV